MKAWIWVLILPILGSWADAQSLGDVAKREQQRRDKARKDGAPTKVLTEDDLAGPARPASPSPEPAARTGAGGKGPAATGEAAGMMAGSGNRSEVEIRRAAARDRLEEAYQRIAPLAYDMFQAIHEYAARCQTIAASTTTYCQSLASAVNRLVPLVADAMEAAEEAARQGWLAPGDVREVRRRYGMDDVFWDRLGEAVRDHRRSGS